MPKPSPCSYPSGQILHASLAAVVFTCLVLILLLCSAAHGQESDFSRSWRIANFEDDLKVNHDGSADLIEELTLVFAGQFNGIYRRIPVEYPGPDHANFTLFLRVNAVTDDDGHPLKYSLSTSNGYRVIRIFIPGAADATRKVEIYYHVDNATRFFEDHDEVYWNVTGLDWPVPIDHAEAHISFPVAATGSMRVEAFTGPYGSQAQAASIAIDGSTVNIKTDNPLPLRWGLTADVYLPTGVLQEPNRFVRAGWFLRSNPILALPLVVFGVMFTLWLWKGKDPDPGMSVAPLYEPPKDMPPSETGALVTDRVYPRDITCILVDLAVRGFLKIKEVTSTELMFFHHKDYELGLLKSGTDLGSLSDYERLMVDRLFSGGSVALLSDQRNRFYTVIPTIQAAIMSSL